MKIRYMSDLHNEFRDDPVPKVDSVGEDVVVLAGDIDVGTRGIHWAQKAFAGRPVIYLLGNHEFYGRDWYGLVLEAGGAAIGSNVHFLEQDAVTIAGTRFLGCSLWTDFKLWGDAHVSEAMGAAQDGMADYTLIKHRGRPLLPSESAERNRQSVAWLQQELTRNVPTVVVTHHAPTQLTAHPAYRSDVLNAAFHSHLDHLIGPPALAWIHGHTHHCSRKVVNGIPVLVNTLGYPDEITEASAFRWDACIEVKP